MKRLLVLLVDFGIIFGSIILSFLLLKNGVLLNYTQNIGAFYFVSPAIICMYLVLSYVFGMYNLRRKSGYEIIYTVSLVSIALTICIMAACFFIRASATSYPRSVILLSLGLYFIGLVAWRGLVHLLYRRKHGQHEVMIVGSNTRQLQLRLRSRFRQLYHIKHICAANDSSLLAKACEVSDIFIASDVPTHIREQLFLLPSEKNRINVFFIPKLQDVGIINARLQRLDDIPMYTFGKMYLSEEERGVKRMMDIIISSILIIGSSPLLLIIAIALKLQGGKVIYQQERYSRNRKRFNIYKFRTMISNAEDESGPVLSGRKDHRITPIGKLLRQSRLDELPQLFNVLVGDMSLVGPRPERPYFADRLEQQMPEFKLRLHVKAGITGWAQIMSKYSTEPKQKLHYDLYYINNYSVFRDLLIMLQTIRVFFWKDSTEGVS